jgi:hypothetical protein
VVAVALVARPPLIFGPPSAALPSRADPRPVMCAMWSALTRCHYMSMSLQRIFFEK